VKLQLPCSTTAALNLKGKKLQDSPDEDGLARYWMILENQGKAGKKFNRKILW
jgi:hypothetical protein